MAPASSRSFLAAGLVLALLLAGLALAFLRTAEPDGADDARASAEPLTYIRDIQPVFDAACLSCHFHGQAIGNLDLAPAVAYDSLVGVASTQAPMMRVEPGDPEASYLVHKLQGTHLEVGGRGDRMPFGLHPLRAEVLAEIRTWIEQGAVRGEGPQTSRGERP